MKLALPFAFVAVLAFAPQALAASPAPRALVSAASAPLPAIAAAKTPPALLRDVRMCTNEAFLRSSFRCLRDERSRPFVSTAAVCSLTIYAYSAVTVRASMSFGGKTLFSRTRKYPRRTRVSLAVFYELTFPLPAGSFSCTVKVGKKKATARMRSVGPAGPVVASAVCSSTSARPDGTGCATDESAAPVGPASSLTCSGFFVGQQGKQAVVELLYNDGVTWTSVFAAPVAVPRPILGVYIAAPGPLGQQFAGGEYACRFSAGGQVLLEKRFTVQA